MSIRPVYHQKGKNVEAHIFLGILSYFIVSMIRYRLKQKGINYSWKNIVEIMDSQKIITTTFKDEKETIRFIRQCSVPTAKAHEIYEALKLKHYPFTKKKGVVTQL